jgi:Flp pilus assembly protein CpaB
MDPSAPHPTDLTAPLRGPVEALRRRLRSVRRAVLVRRRPLAALFAAVAVLAGLRAAAAPPPETVSVLVAAQDLPAGATLSTADLHAAEFSPASVPEGVAEEPAGRVLAAPVRAGEPVTDVRLVGRSLAEAQTGLSALPLRLPDAGVVELLEAGDRVELVATDPADGTAEVVATDVLVLAVPSASPDGSAGTGSGLSGRLVVVAVPPDRVTDISAAAVTRFLSVAYTH